MMNLEKLESIIKQRQQYGSSETSYVAGLFNQGSDRIVQKVGEEAIEVVIASKNSNRQKVIGELADLFMHTLVLMADKGLKLEDVYTELDKRNSKVSR